MRPLSRGGYGTRVPDRWRLVVVAYLAWVIAFTVVEGFGREACRVPTRAWIAAAGSARERAVRDDFRARANLCLDETGWYAYGTRGLVLASLALPLAAVWLVRRRGELMRGLVAAAALAVTVGSIATVRWLYDWMA